jgi:hypothetical protein
MSGDQEQSARLTRREMLKTSALAGAGFSLSRLGFDREWLLPGSVCSSKVPASAGTMMEVKFRGYDTVRVGIIGVGGRGSELLRALLPIEHIQVRAICDIVKEQVLIGQKAVTDAGQKEPHGYFRGDHDFERLCSRDDLDIIYIATPWEWHVPMALSAMRNGKHVALEVPAATTLEDCWALVDKSEQTRCHCTMLENRCYGHHEMMVLNMIRDGVFGNILHGETAYIHRVHGLPVVNEGEGLWRNFPHMKRMGNLYPTHGLGPLARYMDINRGDRFESISSVSSIARGLALHEVARMPAGKSMRKACFGREINTSVITTATGRTVTLQHDIIDPRTYDRLSMVVGTKGAFRDYPPMVCIGRPEQDAWTTLDVYKDRYEDSLWTGVRGCAGNPCRHGDMDSIMNRRLIQCMREGLAPDIDVYDAATWSASGPLSILSMEKGGAPVQFPDFTRGKALSLRA